MCDDCLDNTANLHLKATRGILKMIAARIRQSGLCALALIATGLVGCHGAKLTHENLTAIPGTAYPLSHEYVADMLSRLGYSVSQMLRHMPARAQGLLRVLRCGGN